MHILFLLLLLLQGQPSSIDGIVTKPGGNEPLAGATVTLNPTSGESAELRRVAVTGEDGRFTMNDVAPGNYELGAESTQYGYVLYGQRRPGGPGIVLPVAAGQAVTGVRLAMIPTGAISGRVLQRNGEPASNALVQAFKYGYEDGKRALQSVQITTSDDRGEYRLFWLPAGQYVVAGAFQGQVLPPNLIVTMPPGRISRLRIEGDAGPLLMLETFLRGTVIKRLLDDGTVQEESWAPVYYPSTADARFAVPLDVAPGATMTGANIVIGPARVQRIRGQVISGSSAGSAEVALMPQNSFAGVQMLLSRQATAANGVFEFRGVLPGSYIIEARDREGAVSPAIPVEVGDRDIGGLQVPLVPGVQIGVTVLLDNPSESAAPRPLAGIGARLVSEIPTLLDPATNGQSGSPGRTTFRSVPPGNYQIEIESTRYHVKSMHFGNQDATDGIHVSAASPTSLQIVLTTESGSLEGTVSGAGKVGVPGATVVLVPARGRKRASLYKSAVTDSEGRYRFENIALGDYILFAWENVETGAWQNADFMRLYETRGQPVRISGNNTQDTPLTLIPSP